MIILLNIQLFNIEATFSEFFAVSSLNKFFKQLV